MERKKYILTLLFLLLFASALANGGASNRSLIYKAYISGEMTLWKGVVDKMQINLKPEPDYLLELLNYQYGYIGWALGSGNKSEAEKYLQRVKNNLNLLKSKTGETSMTLFYASVINSFSIPFNKLKIAHYGMESLELAERSLERDAANPYANMQYASCYYYMPAIFGGSKSTGLLYYSKARKYMELSSYDNNEDWNYLSLLVQIAQVYADLKKYEEALDIYRLILKREPGFVWVKNELYPKVLKRKK